MKALIKALRKTLKNGESYILINWIFNIQKTCILHNKKTVSPHNPGGCDTVLVSAKQSSPSRVWRAVRDGWAPKEVRIQSGPRLMSQIWLPFARML